MGLWIVGLAVIMIILPLAYNSIVYQFTRVPYLPTPKKRNVEIFQLLEDQGIQPEETIFVDLGSGLGHVMRAAEKEKYKEVRGYELSPLHVIQSNIFFWLGGYSSRAMRKNILYTTLDDVNIVYYFLTKHMMGPLGDHLEKKLKKDALIIGLGNPLTGWTPIMTKKVESGANIYLYKKS